MTDTVFRIIGPNSNRLLTVINVANLPPGHIHPDTARFLMKYAEWRPYSGPGRANAGWLIPGTDPTRKPHTLKAGN